MKLETLAETWQRIRRTSTTSTTSPGTQIPTKHRGAGGVSQMPSGKGDAAANTTRSVFPFMDLEVARSGGGLVQNCVQAKFYGEGSDGNTATAEFWGWALVCEEGNLDTAFWDPTLLCQLTLTLGASPVGVANCIVDASDKFVDTIAKVYGNDDISLEIVSPANNIPAHIVLDMKGCQLLEVVLYRVDSTDINGMIRKY